MASTRREKELARQRAERQAARRAAAAAKRKQRNLILASAAAVLLVIVAAIGVGAAVRSGSDDSNVASDDPSASAPAEPAASASPDAPGTCTYDPGRPASKPAPTPPTTGVGQTPVTATLMTSQGPIVLALDAAKAPCTVNSFRSLAGADYFDGTTCHRLTSGGLSVLQCGDPTGSGSGGPGYSFKDENLDGATYPRGTVAMANAGPGTNGSQFFLVYADSTLPPKYTPFGKIVSGLDVLEKVAAGGSTPPGDGKPTLPVQITEVQIAPA